MDSIIVIRISDPEGSVFQNILKVLSDTPKDIVQIANHGNMEYTFAGLTVNVDSGTVFREGKHIRLNYGEFSILKLMTQRPHHIFSKEQIYSSVYGDDHYNSNTVQNTICRLRSKIEPDPHHPIYIKTVVGLGYKFTPPTE